MNIMRALKTAYHCAALLQLARGVTQSIIRSSQRDNGAGNNESCRYDIKCRIPILIEKPCDGKKDRVETEKHGKQYFCDLIRRFVCKRDLKKTCGEIRFNAVF